MITLICNQKGGVGKSTLLLNVAALLANQGKDVLILDADRQITASEWWAERRLSHPEKPKIACVQQYGEIDEILENLNTRYEHIIVDVTGRDSEEMRSAMIVSHKVILPFRPSQADLNVLPTMIGVVKQAKRFNKTMSALVCLTQAPTNVKNKEVEQAIETINAYNEIPLMSSIVYDRKAFRDAFIDGLGVCELNGHSDSESSAKREMELFVKEIYDGI